MPKKPVPAENGATSYHFSIIKALIASLADGVAVFDAARRVIFINPAMAAMTGLPREGFYVKELTKLFAGEQVSIERKLEEAVTRRETTRLAEVRLVSFYYDLHVTPIVGEDGSVIGGAVILHDITQFKELELAKNEIERQKTRFETLIESIGDGVVAIGLDWKITVWNRASSQIAGWSKEEAVGKPFREVVRFVRQRDMEENYDFIAGAMAEGRVRTMDQHTILIAKDGKEVPVGDSAAPVFDEHGKVDGAIIIFRDVSAEQESEMLRSSFAYASHQLRTPISKALWSLQDAGEQTKIKEIQENLNVAIHAIESIRKMSGMMLETADIDEHRVALKLVDVQLGDAMREAVDSAKPIAAVHRVTVEVVPADIAIKTDRTLLIRILQELLDNAIVYSPAGATVRISVSLKGGDAIIEVSDSGIGIPPEQQEIIFTKFFRGHNIPQESVGAGLGLHIVREYAKLLKAKIWFTSDQGKGTKFYLSVPVS